MYWVVGDHLRFKLTTEDTNGQFALAVNWEAPGGGPPPHIHHREDELFHILEGELDFVFEHKTMRGRAGDTVFLPRGIVHTFRSAGPTPAKFVVIAAPAGFDKFAAEAGEPIDTIPHNKAVGPADIGKLMSVVGKYGLEMCPTHQCRGEAMTAPQTTAHWVLGHLVHVKLRASDTNGSFSLATVTSPPGALVPPHAHDRESEAFLVLQGEYEFTLEQGVVKAPAGTFIFVKPGEMHGFRNIGTTTAKLFDLHSPGGFERFFCEVGTPCTDESKPPAFAPPTHEQAVAMFGKYGMTLGKL
jgi:quercetin dioxygenase-like cupin family protein